MTAVCYQYLSASGQNVNLLQVPGDLVVGPVKAPQLAGVVCPVEKVEQKESEREEKSKVSGLHNLHYKSPQPHLAKLSILETELNEVPASVAAFSLFFLNQPFHYL